MAANDDATVTIDTGEMVYTDKGGQTHTVTNAETFVFDLIAATTGSNYQPLSSGNRLACTDGTDLHVISYPTYSSFNAAADATAQTNAGSIWFRENDGSECEWHIRTVTIDNVDEPTEITAMTLERADNPMITMTLTTVTVAQ